MFLPHTSYAAIRIGCTPFLSAATHSSQNAAIVHHSFQHASCVLGEDAELNFFLVAGISGSAPKVL